MKKVGILTLPLHENYGGMLQAVALYNFLKEHNYDVVFLSNTTFRHRFELWVRTFIERIPFQNFKTLRYIYLKGQFHKPFLKKYLPNQTRNLRSLNDFAFVTNQENLDAIVVGSDQVWRWDYIKDGFERYFLSFAKGTKTRKIAYAASFGKSHWQASEKKQAISTLLNDFYAVSTREADGISVCDELGVKNCTHVIDPTLLINKNFYTKFLSETDSSSLKNKSNKSLLTYVLDQHGEKQDFIDNVARNLGSQYQVSSLGLQSFLTVPEWVTAIHDSDFVITDSFHGMVFCIIFNKQFVVIINADRGASRFTSLLKQLNLESRLIDEKQLGSHSAKELVENLIDYKEVNAKVNELRTLSSEFLLKALS
ncbi:MAG: polysaccharide pyruvyl transferase family protein [Methylophilus sp.]|uniref:polysaccharide pyruvyl transferase family protein n=1 Tax=Methylophilus sp. TaxID=29541 RepID=UPI003F9F64D3